jgi:hypothetical protein
MAHEGSLAPVRRRCHGAGHYDGPVTQPTQPPAPGERRLDRPPSDRYRTADAATDASAAASTDPGSAGRALAWGALVAIAGAAATVVLGGVLALSAGLLVVAAATGWAIGKAVALGGGTAMRRRRRPWTAVALAAGAVVLGQVGLWLFARTEGGVLPLPEYLVETFGPLVPIQAILAVAVAWWAAR